MKFARLRAHAARHSIGYLALFVAATGTSYAAVQLAANSVTSREVKNGSLLRIDFKRGQLPAGARGDRGPAGLQGAPGLAGPSGSAGPAGPAGPLPTTLPSGKTLTGRYTIGNTATAIGQESFTSISFQFPLATAPTQAEVLAAGPFDSHCPGVGQAAPGFLCYYLNTVTNAVRAYFNTLNPTTGADIRASAVAAGFYGVNGTWAVTAP
jgi:hypothetical protein